MFSQAVLDHVQRLRNTTPLPAATHKAAVGEKGAGAYIILSFEVRDGIVRKGAYETNGCPAIIACASMTVELCLNRAVGACLQLDPEDLLAVLGGLPEGKEDRASMTITALQRALGGNDR